MPAHHSRRPRSSASDARNSRFCRESGRYWTPTQPSVREVASRPAASQPDRRSPPTLAPSHPVSATCPATRERFHQRKTKNVSKTQQQRADPRRDRAMVLVEVPVGQLPAERVPRDVDVLELVLVQLVTRRPLDQEPEAEERAREENEFRGRELRRASGLAAVRLRNRWLPIRRRLCWHCRPHSAAARNNAADSASTISGPGDVGTGLTRNAPLQSAGAGRPEHILSLPD
jgi:hypothetical protein